MRIKRRGIPKPALVSLVATAGVAAALIVIWIMIGDEPETPAVMRNLSDVELTWRCEVGHVIKGPIPAGLPHCTNCGREAWAVIDFNCPNHGRVEVEASFEADPSGVARIARFRATRGEWVRVGNPLLCPKCGAELKRKLDDPLEKVLKAKKKGASP